MLHEKAPEELSAGNVPALPEEPGLPFEEPDAFLVNPDHLASLSNLTVKHELLPQAETRELIKKVQSQEDSPEAQEEREYALGKLIVHNQGLIGKVIGDKIKYTGDLSENDLKQLGRIGIMKAAQEFDLSRDNKFSTYAYQWIRQAISKAVMDTGSTIRRPVHMHMLFTRYDRIVREYGQTHNGDRPGDAYIAKTLDIQIEKIALLANMEQKHLVSLDMSYDDNDREKSGLINTITTDDSLLRAVERESIRDSQSDLIKDLLHCLSPREKDVVVMRSGIFAGKQFTLEQIAKYFFGGISGERIRQIEEKARQKLLVAKNGVSVVNGLDDALGLGMAVRIRTQAIEESFSDKTQRPGGVQPVKNGQRYNTMLHRDKRQWLIYMTNDDTYPAETILRARVLLDAVSHPDSSLDGIARRTGSMGISGIQKLLLRYSEGGIPAALLGSRANKTKGLLDSINMPRHHIRYLRSSLHRIIGKPHVTAKAAFLLKVNGKCLLQAINIAQKDGVLPMLAYGRGKRFADTKGNHSMIAKRLIDTYKHYGPEAAIYGRSTARLKHFLHREDTETLGGIVVSGSGYASKVIKRAYALLLLDTGMYLYEEVAERTQYKANDIVWIVKQYRNDGLKAALGRNTGLLKDNEDKQALWNIIKHANLYDTNTVMKPARALLSISKGMPYSETAKTLGTSISTLERWVKRYRAGGLSALGLEWKSEEDVPR